MSLVSWHDYGYGICADMITMTDSSLRNFITGAKETYERILEYIAESWIDGEERNKNITIEERKEKAIKYFEKTGREDLIELVGEYDDCSRPGLAAIICDVISEHSDLLFLACVDCNSDNSYVILAPFYPWKVNRETLLKLNSEDDIKSIIADNLAVLTTQDVTELNWGYHSIEGWG